MNYHLWTSNTRIPSAPLCVRRAARLQPCTLRRFLYFRQTVSFVFYLFYFPPFSICNVFQYHLRDGAQSTSAQNNFSYMSKLWSCTDSHEETTFYKPNVIVSRQRIKWKYFVKILHLLHTALVIH